MTPYCHSTGNARAERHPCIVRWFTAQGHHCSPLWPLDARTTTDIHAPRAGLHCCSESRSCGCTHHKSSSGHKHISHRAAVAARAFPSTSLHVSGSTVWTHRDGSTPHLATSHLATGRLPSVHAQRNAARSLAYTSTVATCSSHCVAGRWPYRQAVAKTLSLSTRTSPTPSRFHSLRLFP